MIILTNHPFFHFYARLYQAIDFSEILADDVGSKWLVAIDLFYL
jgi:hypothetical protein